MRQIQDSEEGEVGAKRACVRGQQYSEEKVQNFKNLQKLKNTRSDQKEKLIFF